MKVGNEDVQETHWLMNPIIWETLLILGIVAAVCHR